MNVVVHSAGDIDIDVADRDQILALVPHIPASINKDGACIKHNTGIYVCSIPKDPLSGYASLDYQTAEQRGYVKVDILNNSVYRLVASRQQLEQLAQTEPDWQKLNQIDFFSQLVHIGNHYALYKKLAEPVSCLYHMAMFLALIRPAKRHLVGQTWNQIEQTIWEKSQDGSYGFKKSHAMSYALLVSVHMQLVS